MAYLLIAGVFGAIRLSLTRNRESVVLCYHAVTDRQQPRFEAQMCHVARMGAISVEHLGKPGIAGVCLTFDDAFECLLSNALPVLQRLELPATIFAVSGNLGATPRWKMPPRHPESQERTMPVDVLRALGGLSGVRIGSHTVSHARLSTLDDVALAAELETSRRDLSAAIGVEIVDLAYPHGDGGEREFAAAISTGYRRVFSLDEDVVSGGGCRRRFGRFVVSPDMWMAEFRLTIAGAYAWLGPWRRFLRRLRALVSGSAARGRLAVRASQS
ncbi:MAG: polysaccharide deacetylase family protein [Phycisphaerales bacterium]|nr:polysaccharide deacetylase family protein [Phycisphaerales bacterium]